MTSLEAREKLIDAAAFLFLAIPGLGCLLFGAALVLLSKDSSGTGLGIILALASAPIILVGVRKTREPLYLLVILSIPFGLIVTALIAPDGDKGLPGCVIGGLAWFTLSKVNRFYRRKKGVREQQSWTGPPPRG